MMELLFTGTDSVLPELGNDTASCVVDGQVMVDFGWHGACQLEAHGVEPWNLRAGCLTHLHQDLFISLVPLLFYTYLCQAKRTVAEPLRIIGPASGIAELVDRARAFLRMGGDSLPFPPIDVAGVRPGDKTTVGHLTIQVGPSTHNVESVAFRIASVESGQPVSVVLSGDTGYCAELAEFAAGTDLLVHEASHGAAAPTPGSAHSCVDDACRVAEEADVGALALMHLAGPLREGARQRAEELRATPILMPLPGNRVIVRPGGVQ